MTNRENVILGIENCLQTDSVTECSRTECPFIKCREACLEWLLRSALTLLKEQEPRVLTLEELLNLPKDTSIFIEEDNGDCGWNVFYEIDEEYDVCFCGFQARPIFYPSKSYGKSWRCWSAQPTDEQRKTVKWE